MEQSVDMPEGNIEENLHPPFQLLDTAIAVGEYQLLKLTTGQSFFGQPLDIPVSVIHGVKPGPVLCLIAAVHGDELNGIEAVRRIMEETNPQDLFGTLIGIPVANVQGFTQGVRYLPDRRDLNRYFPGRAYGSLASRVAHLIYHNVISRCTYLVDFHTGSFKRINLPQLRADMTKPEVRKLALNLGVPILHKPAAKGTLRNAAVENGIAAVTIELGEPATIELSHVESGVATIRVLLNSLNMIVNDQSILQNLQTTYYRSHWVRVNHGGILLPNVILGEVVERNALIGVSINPLTNERHEIKSPVAGKILGMAKIQFMLPGFAAFHIGSLSQDTIPPLDQKSESDLDTEVYD
ncbi:MAG: succinylglutamate desuccinylase/aspartoacylase family protein [Gammaproteobacteria bacterium]|nr:succinylglutamate desuccinylase/aspartoacylase family protein [Gammaproteobacteria bacterium]